MSATFKKILPAAFAAMMLLSSAPTPLFAEEATNTSEESKTDSSTTETSENSKEDQKPTAGKSVKETAQTMLDGLKKLDTKTFSEEQMTEYNKIVDALTKAIDADDEAAMNTAMDDGTVFLKTLVDEPETKAPTEDTLKKAKDLMAKTEAAIKAYGGDWKQADLEAITAQASLLERAVTANEDDEAVLRQIQSLLDAFKAVNLDIDNMTLEDIQAVKEDEATKDSSTTPTPGGQSSTSTTRDAKSSTGLVSNSALALGGSGAAGLAAAAAIANARRKKH